MAFAAVGNVFEFVNAALVVVVNAAAMVVVPAKLCTLDYPSMTRLHYYPFSGLELPRRMVCLEEPRV